MFLHGLFFREQNSVRIRLCPRIRVARLENKLRRAVLTRVRRTNCVPLHFGVALVEFWERCWIPVENLKLEVN